VKLKNDIERVCAPGPLSAIRDITTSIDYVFFIGTRVHFINIKHTELDMQLSLIVNSRTN